MRTLLPGIYVVGEAEKRRCTVKGQVREWGFAWFWGLVAAALLFWAFGQETWLIWGWLAIWFGWFWTRNGWVGTMREELEDEERALLGPDGAHKIAKRAEWLWGLVVVAVVCHGYVVLAGGWDALKAGRGP